MRRKYILCFLFIASTTSLFAQVYGSQKVEKNYFLYLITVIAVSCCLFLYFLWNSKKRLAIQTAKESFAPPPPVEIIHDKEPHNKQYEFQKFVVNQFDKPTFNIYRWGDNGVATNSIKGRRDPNLIFFAFNNGLQERFAIECKWRKRNFRIFGGFKWAEPSEVINYREFSIDERMPVFVVIGTGGTPAEPAEMYLAKLTELDGGVVSFKDLEKFKVGSNIKQHFTHCVMEHMFINSYTGVNKFA